MNSPDAGGRQPGHAGEAAPAPLLRVVRGSPSAEELAALVAVVAVRTAAQPEQKPPARALSAWTDRRQTLHHPGAPGAGAWVASGLAAGTRTRAGW